MSAQSTNARFSEPSTGSQEEDLLLVRAAVEGNEKAKRLVVEKVYDRVQRTLACISNCEDEVDDLTQNALIEVLRSLENYRGEAPLEYWADRIAVRTAAKRFDKRRRRERLMALALDDIVPKIDFSLDEAAEHREVLRRIQHLITALGDHNRLPLVLHHVKGRLRRSRRWLRREVMRDEVLAEWVSDEIGRRET
jgi:RNA polymerase sigma factor (sigma-70 family)